MYTESGYIAPTENMHCDYRRPVRHQRPGGDEAGQQHAGGQSRDRVQKVMESTQGTEAAAGCACAGVWRLSTGGATSSPTPPSPPT